MSAESMWLLSMDGNHAMWRRSLCGRQVRLAAQQHSEHPSAGWYLCALARRKSLSMPWANGFREASCAGISEGIGPRDVDARVLGECPTPRADVRVAGSTRVPEAVKYSAEQRPRKIKAKLICDEMRACNREWPHNIRQDIAFSVYAVAAHLPVALVVSWSSGPGFAALAIALS